MTKFAIELPESYGVTSRDIGVSCDVSKLSAEIVAKLALHGLTQKIGDSAASAMADAGFKGQKFTDLDDAGKAKVNEHAKAAMLATIEALVKGEWSERRAAEAVDPQVARVRVLFGELLRANAKDVWAKQIKPLEAADRGKALDELLATQDADFVAEINAQAKAQLAAEAKAKQKLGGLKLTIAV